VLHLERVRLARGEPLAVLRNWLPESVLDHSDADFETAGLYQLMRARGVRMRVERQRIGARGATAAEAKLLGERRNAPLLTMERATFDDFGRAVEWGSHVYRPQTYSFEVTLVER
jgi:DNA-binding GntR family transcriptional regulator